MHQLQLIEIYKKLKHLNKMFNLPIDIIQHHIIKELNSRDIINLLSIDKYFYGLRFKLMFVYRVTENIFKTNYYNNFTNIILYDLDKLKIHPNIKYLTFDIGSINQ